ncbi:hypothetical protein [Sebaldella termitidis]|jgi:hypothetical protein|uniref:Uncharacterized protein n=2 Tax=Sebaldella TaxID=32068 RepID=D1AKI7_SEBTE|nr:hypothetical protein [Sebaldella termitidis]ACZ09103.1 hypothetical protein Sterm_2249 [Sebaldella termitidis ATCC 33386]
MMKLSEGNKEKLLKIIVILGIILSVFGVLSKIFEITIFDFLKNESEEYMRNSYNQSKTLFLTLSVIKGTMGVIEGSTLNANAVIGINLELGDIIEPVYEMINILWKTSLLSVVILKIETLYFGFFTMKLSTFLLSVSMIFIAPWVFIKNKFTEILSKISKYFFYSFLFIYLLIPSVLFMTSKVVNVMETEYKEPAIKRIEQNVGNLNSSAEALFRPAENTSIFNIKGQVDTYKDKIDSFKTEAGNVTESISEDVPLIIGVTIFGYIILPLLLTIFLYKLAKSLVMSKFSK